MKFNRRNFVKTGALALGALGSEKTLLAGSNKNSLPHFSPKAKSIIYLCQSGGPSHIDLFDYHPEMKKLHGTELPDSVRGGQRVTGMTAGQKNFPVCAPIKEFKQHGQSGTWVSEFLPYTSKIVDDITVIKSMHTEAINHDPGITFLNTGSQIPGRPSFLPSATFCFTVSVPLKPYSFLPDLSLLYTIKSTAGSIAGSISTISL